MFFTPQRLPVSWLSVCIALAGAAYCAIQAAPTPIDVPCPGTGCHLFQDFTIMGISLWWAGVAYFAFMLLLLFRRIHGFALVTAALALCADAVLLVIMLFTASCVACLGAAALMGLLFLVLRRHVHAKTMPPPGPSVILLVWAGLFVAAVVAAGTEQARPWQIAGPKQAERRVYFSPSCPACRDAVTVFAGSAAFIPVAEKESDYPAIYAMRAALENGKTLVEALAASDNAPPIGFGPEILIFRFKLLRNKAEVLRLDFEQLPLIMINGMPQNLRPAPPAAPRPAEIHTPPRDDAALPPELSAIDSCGGQNPEPCDP